MTRYVVNNRDLYFSVVSSFYMFCIDVLLFAVEETIKKNIKKLITILSAIPLYISMIFLGRNIVWMTTLALLVDGST